MTKRIISSAGIQTFRVSVMAFTMALLGGCVSIQSAAHKGDLKEVRKQLTSGTNVNSETFRMRRSALHEAAGNGHIEIVKLLLEKGADVNIRENCGATPLHRAAHGGHTKVMKILLQNGADTFQRGTGCGTPLEWAARKGQLKAIEILLDHGADVNYETPLHAAVETGHVEIVDYLVARGADVNKRGAGGCTPLHCTFRGQQLDGSEEMKKIRRILQTHGADPTIPCGRHHPTILPKDANQKTQKGYLVKLLTGDLK